MSIDNAFLMPRPGEIQLDHYERVFPLLSGTTEERNAAILNAWDQSEEARSLDEIAARKLPPERFARGKMVPVFSEHSGQRVKRDASGKPVRDNEGNLVTEEFPWDRDRLAALAYQMNHRIRDTSSFSPITRGHTPDEEARAKGAEQPPVIGYAGKYRLGKIGNVNPRWTIFADEYHDARHAGEFQTLTRRSPEVWVNAAQPFFDPIAALGAETPRLEMGTAIPYSRSCWLSAGRDGAEVERYSMSTMTVPGPMNVQQPTFGDQSEKYEADDAGDEMSGIVEEVVNALRQLPEIQLLQQLGPMLPTLQQMALQAELPPIDEGHDEPDGDESPNALGVTPESQPSAGAPAPQPVATPPAQQPPQAGDDPDKNMMTRYMAGEINEPELRAYRDSKKQAVAPVSPNPQAAQHYQMQAEIDDRKRKLAALDREIEGKAKVSAERERYSRLSAMRDQGFEFDLAPEYQHCLDMTDAQFDRHVSQVVTKYSRTPIGGQFMPVVEDVAPQKYTKSDQDAAVKYALAEREKGRDIDFRTALKEITQSTGTPVK